MRLKKSDQIITYDRNSNAYSTRVYWMFRVMGHPSIRVLDGGFKAWTLNGHSTEKEEYNPEVDYDYKFNENGYATLTQV